MFDGFELTDDAAVSQYTDAKITVTAYAIQKANIATASAAWTAGGFN